ncbi:MAG: putative ABC transport system permease protein [Verrucomicrobiales bacterium]
MHGLRLIYPVIIRYALRHKVIAALNVLSVALGVAVYLAIQTANFSANSAFQAGVDLVAGKSQLEVRAMVRSEGVDDTLLPQIANFPGVKAVTPVVEGYVTLPGKEGEYLRIVGVDPFSNTDFRTGELGITSQGYQTDLDGWLARPNFLALSTEFCERNELAQGETFQVLVNGETVDATVGFVIDRDTSKDGYVSTRVAAMDIGWAQELLGTSGKLTSIQLALDDPTTMRETIAALEEMLPESVAVATPQQRSLQVQLMLEGFQLNLRALSMVSLLVGVFLIYNTVSASVVRRRKEIGTLRSMGASSRQVLGMFLLEAIVVGLIGVTLGVFGGIVLARSLLDAMSQVVSMHYILVSIEQPFFSPQRIAEASIAGFATVILGAWLPAREAARIQPVDALRNPRLFESKSPRASRLCLLGAAFVLLAGVLAWLALVTGPAWLSFAACFFLMAGFSLIMPQLALSLGLLTRRWVGGNIVARLSTEDFVRSLNRTAVTSAALMAAIAMMIGVAVMITSFRDTLVAWIDRTVIADVYITPAANEVIGIQAFLPESLRTELLAAPEVEAVDRFRDFQVVMDGQPANLAVVDGTNRQNLAFTGGDDPAKTKRFFEPDQVIVSEILAARRDLAAGDSVALRTPAGVRQFTVTGVYYDYADSQGRMMMTRKNFDIYWDDQRFHSMGVFLKEGVADTAIQDLIDKIRTSHSGDSELAIYSNRALRQRALDIFDQTFAITHVLRLIAIVVAALGIVLSLTTLVMERSREIALYRSLGATQRQVIALFLGEGALLGLASSIAGVVCGVILSMVLTWVVNKAFFGWTIDFRIPISELLWTPVWVIPVAVLAAFFPAWKASKVQLSQALRTE